jgi:hypothetical protein
LVWGDLGAVRCDLGVESRRIRAKFDDFLPVFAEAAFLIEKQGCQKSRDEIGILGKF